MHQKRSAISRLPKLTQITIGNKKQLASEPLLT